MIKLIHKYISSALSPGRYANIPSGSKAQYCNAQLSNTPTYSTNTATAGGPQSLPSGMDQSLVLSLNLYPIKSIADKDPHIIDQ